MLLIHLLAKAHHCHCMVNATGIFGTATLVVGVAENSTGVVFYAIVDEKGYSYCSLADKVFEVLIAQFLEVLERGNCISRHAFFIIPTFSPSILIRIILRQTNPSLFHISHRIVRLTAHTAHIRQPVAVDQLLFRKKRHVFLPLCTVLNSIFRFEDNVSRVGPTSPTRKLVFSTRNFSPLKPINSQTLPLVIQPVIVIQVDAFRFK